METAGLRLHTEYYFLTIGSNKLEKLVNLIKMKAVNINARIHTGCNKGKGSGT
jgi:hypothetical protein